MPLFHPFLASRRIQFCSVCSPFFLNSDGFVWLPHHPRSFTQALRLWRTPSHGQTSQLMGCPQAHLPLATSHTSSWPCLCTKAQTPSLVKQRWWVEPVFPIYCSKNVLGEGRRSLVREVGWSLSTEGSCFTPSSVKKCAADPSRGRFMRDDRDVLCFWGCAYLCP